MDEYNDEYKFKDDNIRQPDSVKSEALQEDTRSEYQKQIDEAIYLSSMEYAEKEETNRKYEEEIINMHFKISNERRELFRDLLFDLNKLIRFDKETKEIYEIIEPIIDTYCEQFIERCELDDLTYDKIFKALKGIRTNKKNIENLQNILIRKDNLI
jgi:hypothetical protein